MLQIKANKILNEKPKTKRRNGKPYLKTSKKSKRKPRNSLNFNSNEEVMKYAMKLIG